MQRVFVLDRTKKPLMPCHPARARALLKKGKAKVYRRYPFTIILTKREGGDTQPIEIKIDPGSRTTGIVLVAKFSRGQVVIWAANLNHRGFWIKKLLDKRRGVRRSRRSRKTRYRKPRGKSRTKPKGWLAPSLHSRVDNVFNWTRKPMGFVPVSEIAVETVRFDTQKMQNPGISGVEYQEGTLQGYEVREYLLEKWGRKCAYCGARDVPVEVEHIIPRSSGGTDRISNLTIACRECNQRKGDRDIRDFLSHDPECLGNLLSQAKAPLKDVAAVNATRYVTGEVLKSFGVPVSFWSGGRTKYNRVKQGYEKEHWIDAACVGKSGEHVQLAETLRPLSIIATGRGSRQMCAMDKYGFPRTKPKQVKRVRGFQTGDIVKASVPKGRKAGTYVGRVLVRASGSFDISTGNGRVQGISSRYCRLVQRVDGYNYAAHSSQC